MPQKPKEYVIAKKRACVRDYKEKVLVGPLMKQKNTSGYEEIGKEDAEGRCRPDGRRCMTRRSWS